MDLNGNVNENANRRDPCWKYVLQESTNKNNFKCCFCGKITKAGIHRAKKHIVGGYTDVTKCLNAPPDVREEIMTYMEKCKMAKASKAVTAANSVLDLDACGPDADDDEVEEVVTAAVPMKRKSNGDGLGSQSSSSKRGTKTIGPMDLFVKPTAKKSFAKQATINELARKELREQAAQELATWFYEAGIPFHAAKYPSFKKALDKVGQFGLGLKPPTAYEISGPLLQKKKKQIQDILTDHEEEWVKIGCTLMSDGWRDSVVQKDIINFLVHSPKGPVFLESVDVSDKIKDAKQLFVLLDSMVDRIGEENVIQVVTDNASNYIAAGKLLQQRRKHLFWSPCAAHCVDLMLEDIGKILKIKNVIKNAIFLNSYIYNHVGVLNLMRKCTKQRELLRHVVTRFTTTFIIFKSLHEQKSNLRRMFTSDEWNDVQDRIDPIRISDIDEANEWLTGRIEEETNDEFVFENDVLTWEMVDQASGVSEPRYYSRSKTNRGKDKGKAPMIEEEEYNLDEDIEEMETETLVPLHEGLEDEDGDDESDEDGDDESEEDGSDENVESEENGNDEDDESDEDHDS